MTPGGHTFSNGDHFPQGAVILLVAWYVQTDGSFLKYAGLGYRYGGRMPPRSSEQAATTAPMRLNQVDVGFPPNFIPSRHVG